MPHVIFCIAIKNKLDQHLPFHQFFYYIKYKQKERKKKKASKFTKATKPSIKLILSNPMKATTIAKNIYTLKSNVAKKPSSNKGEERFIACEKEWSKT